MTDIDREKKVIFLMIRLYCQKHHQGKILCEKCAELKSYAFKRIDKCPYKTNKPKCSKCVTHCYRNEKREKIRQVMRYAGPKMIYRYPVIALKHMLK